jgi:hypothetical protein
MVRFIRVRATERGAVCLPTTIPNRAGPVFTLLLPRTTRYFPCRLEVNAPVKCTRPDNLALRGKRLRAGDFRLPDVRAPWRGGR